MLIEVETSIKVTQVKSNEDKNKGSDFETNNHDPDKRDNHKGHYHNNCSSCKFYNCGGKTYIHKLLCKIKLRRKCNNYPRRRCLGCRGPNNLSR